MHDVLTIIYSRGYSGSDVVEGVLMLSRKKMVSSNRGQMPCEKEVFLAYPFFLNHWGLFDVGERVGVQVEILESQLYSLFI